MSNTQEVKVIPFIDFVKSQDPEELINHDSWHSCAVGDWVRACEIKMVDDKPSTTCIEELRSYILPEDLVKQLSSSGDFKEDTMYEALNYNHFKSYGDLLEALEQCEFKEPTEGY